MSNPTNAKTWKRGVLILLVVFVVKAALFVAVFTGLMCLFEKLDGGTLSAEVVKGYAIRGLETGAVVYVLTKAAKWLRGKNADGKSKGAGNRESA